MQRRINYGLKLKLTRLDVDNDLSREGSELSSNNLKTRSKSEDVSVITSKNGMKESVLI